MSNSNKGMSLKQKRGQAKNAADGSSQLQFLEETHIDVPAETAMLVAVDQLQDAALKKLMMDMLQETHQRRLAAMDKAHERAETRADKQSDAYIKRQSHGLWIAAAIAVLVLVAFTICVLAGATAEQLWPFSVFFLVPGGVYAMRRFLKGKTTGQD